MTVVILEEILKDLTYGKDFQGNQGSSGQTPEGVTKEEDIGFNSIIREKLIESKMASSLMNDNAIVKAY